MLSLIIYNSVDVCLQHVLDKPMVIFVDQKTDTVKDGYYLVADTIEEVNLMKERKIFYAENMEPGTVKKIYGAIFVGADKPTVDLSKLIINVIKEKNKNVPTAATVRTGTTSL